MRLVTSLLAISLMPGSWQSFAGEGVGGSWLQLERLNQDSNQQLKQIQKKPGRLPAGEMPAETRESGLFHLQQSLQLQSLQKQQSQESTTARQRERVDPGDPSARPRSQLQRQQFQRQQQNQLNNARIQQQIRSGLR